MTDAPILGGEGKTKGWKGKGEGKAKEWRGKGKRRGGVGKGEGVEGKS